jgi:tetratricopeptide (TPR) repeat protein
MTGPVRLTAAVLTIGLLMTAAIELQRVRDRLYPVATIEDSALYLTSSATARRVALEYDSVLADLYWIRAIQYFGGTRRMVEAGETITDPNRRQYDALFPLLDLTTSLDPRFNLAYRFGAIFLSEPPPRGPGRPDLAIRLLEKGLAERPDRWEYLQDIGFVHYWWRQDYKTAAEWFRRASEVPGAPWWLKSLAATTLAEGGDRPMSKAMWEAIRESAEIEWLRHDAERHLAQLRALDEIDALQPVVDRVAAQAAQRRLEWPDVVRAAGWPGVPADPSGTPYDIDERGRVQVSRSSPLWPISLEPKRLNAVPPPS